MIYVLTNPELGWSCVIGAYDSYEKVLKALAQYERVEYTYLEEIDDYVNSNKSNCSIQIVRLNREFD